MTERLLTPTDIAERCQVSTKTILRAIGSGRLRASRLGTRGAYRIRAADLEEWLQAAIVTPPARRIASPLDLEPPVAPRHVATGRLTVPADAGRRDALPGARSAEPVQRAL